MKLKLRVFYLSILVSVVIYFYIIGGLLGSGLALIIFVISSIFYFLFFIFVNYIKKSKNILLRLLRYIFIPAFVFLSLFIFIYSFLTIFRFTSKNNSLPIDDRYLAVIVADGASLVKAKELFFEGLTDQSKYLQEVSKTFPTISTHFIQNGAFTPNGITVWPSSSIPAHTGIITGNYPRNSFVMGQRQFNSHDRRYLSYIGLGILSHKKVLNNIVKTLCEYFPKVRSVDVLQIANRGCSLYVPETPQNEKVIKRASQVVSYTNFISKYTGRNEIPRILVMTLPDIDHQTHEIGLTDEHATELYLEMDKNVASVLDIYKKAGIFEKTLFVLASDHGMGNVTKHLTLDNVMYDLRFKNFQSLKWSIVPEWGSFEATFYVGSRYKFDSSYNSVPLWGGNSDALLYVKGQQKDENGNITQESWDIKATDEMLSNYFVGGATINIIDRLLEYSPGIGLIFSNPQQSVFNIYSNIGKSRIYERKIDGRIEFSYEVLSGKDPLGYLNDKNLKLYIGKNKWFSDEKWLELTYLQYYPDALRRIAFSFESPQSATLHLVSSKDWDFTPYYVSDHVLLGSHGSLNVEESLIPIMFSGPGIKNIELPYARTVDILPTILEYFGVKAENIDGRALPIFSDVEKQNNVINRNLQSDFSKQFFDDEYYYDLEQFYASYDKRIIRIDKKTLQKEILVESIKEALPLLHDKINTSLKLVGFDKNLNMLNFEKIYFAEDKIGPIVKYDLKNRKFIY